MQRKVFYPVATIRSLKQQLKDVTAQLWGLEDKFEKLFMSTKNYVDAVRLAPQRVEELIKDIFQKSREERVQKRLERKKTKSSGLGR